jgi:hypothetical protein
MFRILPQILTLYEVLVSGIPLMQLAHVTESKFVLIFTLIIILNIPDKYQQLILSIQHQTHKSEIWRHQMKRNIG